MGLFVPNMTPALSPLLVWSVVQDEGICKPVKTEPAQSLANDVCSCSLRRRTGERKDNVLTDKEAGEILEKLSSSLPLIPSLLTRHSSSIHFSLISGCCPSFAGANCLPCPVMTMTSTLLSRSALGGG